MTNRHLSELRRHACVLALAIGLTGFVPVGLAQLAIPDGDPPHSADELETLVGPIALYPDDLIGIILPASTYPLEIVQAGRFLERRAEDESLEPDEDWDNSVVALLNYPEALELLDANIDWTWALGEAVLAQQSDVIDAIQRFRERAYSSGNLQSDDRQIVTRNDDVIEIAPTEPEVVYIPYYEPERVVVVQPSPAYYYYPTPYPLYYYPYPVDYRFGYYFGSPFFWGVTSVFTIGWHSHYVNVYHHRHHLHPYYAYDYYSPYYWRRGVNVNVHLSHVSDVWHPREHPGARPHVGRGRSVASTEGYVDGRSRQTTATRASVSRNGTTTRLAREDARAGARLTQPQRGTAPTLSSSRAASASSRVAAPSQQNERRVESRTSSMQTSRPASARSTTSPTVSMRSREAQQRDAGSMIAGRSAASSAPRAATGMSVAPTRGVQQSSTRSLLANQAAQSQRSVAQPLPRTTVAPQSRPAPQATAAPQTRSAPSRPQASYSPRVSTFAAPRAQSAPRAPTRSAAPSMRQAPVRGGNGGGSPRRAR